MTMHLLRDLDLLKREILSMGGLTEEAISNAITAFVNRDTDLAKMVLAGEDEIDRKEVDIAEECMKVLALHQPVASDLRFIVSVMMVNNDLERIADLAANIAERALFLAGQASRITLPDALTDMAGTVREMVTSSLDALVNQNEATARNVIVTDDVVDSTHRRLFETFHNLIRKTPESLDQVIQILSISRYLERIGDHATNIAEEVIFMVSGEVIRHQPDAGERPRP